MYAHKVFEPYTLSHQVTEQEFFELIQASFQLYGESRDIIGEIKNFWSEFQQNQNLHWS